MALREQGVLGWERNSGMKMGVNKKVGRGIQETMAITPRASGQAPSDHSSASILGHHRGTPTS